MGHGVVDEAVALLWGGEERRVGELVDPAYRDHAAAGPAAGRRRSSPSAATCGGRSPTPS